MITAWLKSRGKRLERSPDDRFAFSPLAMMRLRGLL